jgi:hypothetical protein
LGCIFWLSCWGLFFAFLIRVFCCLLFLSSAFLVVCFSCRLLFLSLLLISFVDLVVDVVGEKFCIVDLMLSNLYYWWDIICLYFYWTLGGVFVFGIYIFTLSTLFVDTVSSVDVFYKMLDD